MKWLRKIVLRWWAEDSTEYTDLVAGDLGNHDARIERLEDLWSGRIPCREINCPVCKHMTLARKHTSVRWSLEQPVKLFFRCWTCGHLFALIPGKVTEEPDTLQEVTSGQAGTDGTVKESIS